MFAWLSCMNLWWWNYDKLEVVLIEHKMCSKQLLIKIAQFLKLSISQLLAVCQLSSDVYQKNWDSNSGVDKSITNRRQYINLSISQMK